MGSSSKEETASDGDTASGGASPSNDGRLFSEGERVLAYHGPRVYGAKANKKPLSLSLFLCASSDVRIIWILEIILFVLI